MLQKKNSLLQFMSSHPLQVNDYSTGDTHDVGRCRTKVVIPCSCRSPHLVVLQQVRIHEYAQLGCMTKGRHATNGLGNPLRGAQTSLDIF